MQRSIDNIVGCMDWSKRGIVCQDTGRCVFVPDQLSDTEKSGVLGGFFGFNFLQVVALIPQ